MNAGYGDEYGRWLELADRSVVEELIAMSGAEEELRESFRCNLAFGTGGLRGIVGAGPNRMNVHTVAKATQGLANYLNARFENPSVAIARDSRRGGEEFSRVAASVLAANGIRAMLYPRIEPTPALSFAVRDLKCSAGICITASHNPAEYNGYKVYGQDGCQITTEAARAIQSEIDAVDVFDDVRVIEFDAAEQAGYVSWIGDETLDRYSDECIAASFGRASGGFKVAYTPLHGTGLECVLKTLSRVGVDDIVVEPMQAVPDGGFPTCPYPNPEIKEALDRGIALAVEAKSDLLLATDPDADRVGVVVIKDDDPVILSGNEVGILLCDYVCEMRALRGDDLKNLVVVTTIVSSAMADALCEDRGFELRRTLTGFKYIGEQIGMLESKGELGRFAFGFEESCGYLAGHAVRDKDAVVACMLICEMARWYRGKGMDLVDAMNALYNKYGYYRSALLSIAYPGADGAARMSGILDGLRTSVPKSIGNYGVVRCVDYASGVEMPIRGGNGDAEPQMLPGSNVLEIQLAGGNKIIIRPSGTEPKMKAYVLVRGESRSEGDAILRNLESAAWALLNH